VPWIELHQSLLRHPKLIRLSASLGVKKQDALWHLLSLWLWALDYAESGDLSGFGTTEIAFAADWTGDESTLIKALQDCRWLDQMVLHDWMDYAGRLVVQREANKSRMRDKRAAHVQRTTETHASHVQGLPTNQPDQPTRPTGDAHTQIDEIANKAYAAYPDSARKDGRTTSKGVVALAALKHAVSKAPDFPWEEYANLISEFVSTPKNLTTWAQIGADHLGLESLRALKAKAKTAKADEWIPPHRRPI
jgi:hypothetical protein